MHRLFLDTNIILDFLGERQPFYSSAAQLLTLADRKKIKFFTSPTSISNAHYILFKYESGKAALKKITKFRVLCEVSVMDKEVVDKAILADFRDFEDAMQYFSALAAKCDTIITRNEKDFKNGLLPVMDAAHFLTVFNSKSS